MDTLPPDAARIQAVVRLLELTVEAAAGLASRAEVEALAMIVEGRQG